jgi:(E)-4-hydroxy-3-methylbut-2-enyl-diphosphate synthase
VNAGSLDKDLLQKYEGPVPAALVASALKEVHYLEEVDFFDIKISVKHSNVPAMVESYRLLAAAVDYPLHLGVTEAGPLPGGLIKSVAGISTLLLEGIGDTIRFSLTADPVEEAKAGRQLLEYLGLRERKGLDLIACPSCGRAEVDVIKVAADAQAVLEAEHLPIQVAVMGCVVNGPGEAREADLGIAAGRGRGHLFVKGQVVRVVPEADMVSALLEEARRLVEEGVEARLAAADQEAAAAASADREQLLQIQGDANQVQIRRRAVAETAKG